ncbi:MAG: hypothetical protein ACLR78_06705 [Roseburia sp.]
MTQRKRKSSGKSTDDPGLSGAAVGLCWYLTGAGYPVRQAWKKQVVDGMKQKQQVRPILCTGRCRLTIKPDGDRDTGDPGIRGIRASDRDLAVI